MHLLYIRPVKLLSCKMRMMISIIIPVYNCERYLKESIGSLLSQSIIHEMELIFVDDGSTDRSHNIILELTKASNNCRVLHQENQGVSSARNKGLKEAKGDFIAFFDADDFAEPTLYEKLLSLATENDTDISIVDYSMVFPDGTVKKHRPGLHRVWTDKEEMLKNFFVSNDICPNPVDKLFRRKIIREIEFPEGYAIGEDMFFVFEALKRAQKVVLDSSDSLYLYQIHEGSAMTSRFNDKHLDPVRLSKRIMDDPEIPKSIWDYAEANYIHEICKMMRIAYKDNGQISQSEEIRSYIQDFSNYSIAKGFRTMSRKHWIALCLMKLSPGLYNTVYTKLRIG